MSVPLVSVIIPARNEAGNIGALISGIEAAMEGLGGRSPDAPSAGLRCSGGNSGALHLPQRLRYRGWQSRRYGAHAKR